MKTIISISLALVFCALATFSAPAQAGAAAAGKIMQLELIIKSGSTQKDVRSRLYLLISKRVGNGGATVGKAHLLFAKGYEYHAEDKWGPNEDKSFKISMALDSFSREDLGGIALLNALDKPNESDFEIGWLRLVGTDQAGNHWVLADYKPATNSQERRWLRSKPEVGDYPALVIPTLEWKEVPAK